jgi:hypothetical protein
MRIVTIVVMALCFVASPMQADENAKKTPILIELFTSEGCSSCPPADKWLERVDADQPVRGVQLIVLSEHVDYWDHDGWKDPYSSSGLTERQANYEHELSLDSPFTPQIIVDGAVNLHINDVNQLRQVFDHAAEIQKVPIKISSVTIDPANPEELRNSVEVDAQSAERGAEIFEAIALDHAESQVLKGENGGHRLTHTAVVRSLTKIGKLEKGQVFTKNVNVKLKPGTETKNLRVIVFAQEPGPGKIIGAAMEKIQ